MHEKLRYWHGGLCVGFLSWFILSISLAFYFHWSFFDSNLVCGSMYEKCSYGQHLLENFPKVFFVLTSDLLSKPFWLLVSLGIILAPTVIGFLIDMRR